MSKKGLMIIIGVAVALLVVVGLGFYFFQKTKKASILAFFNPGLKSKVSCGDKICDPIEDDPQGEKYCLEDCLVYIEDWEEGGWQGTLDFSFSAGQYNKDWTLSSQSEMMVVFDLFFNVSKEKKITGQGKGRFVDTKFFWSTGQGEYATSDFEFPIEGKIVYEDEKVKLITSDDSFIYREEEKKANKKSLFIKLNFPNPTPERLELTDSTGAESIKENVNHLRNHLLNAGASTILLELLPQEILKTESTYQYNTGLFNRQDDLRARGKVIWSLILKKEK